MNLVLLRNDTLNTVFFHPEQRPLYHSDTSFRFRKQRTTIRNISDANSSLTAVIEWHSVGKTTIRVRDRDIALTPCQRTAGVFARRPMSFFASDGRSYMWKYHKWGLMLVTDDDSETTIATFVDPPFKICPPSRQVSLDIAQQGLPLLDDIVTTFIYMDSRRKWL